MAADAVQAAMAAARRFLLASQTAEGAWRDFLLPAGESDGWVTAFVGLALAETGDKEALQAARAAWLHLLRQGKPGGGWGYNAATPADADSTLWALRLANAIGEQDSEAARAAMAFLRQHSRADGGVATYADESGPRGYIGLPVPLRFDGWTQSHECVSAAAANVPRFCTPELAAYLLQRQGADGAWTAYWWFDPEYATAEAVTGLGSGEHCRSAAGWAAERVPGLVAGADRPPAFALAHALRVLRAAGDDNAPMVEMAETALLSWQNADGSWPASARLRVPAPDCLVPDLEAPWKPWQGLPHGARSVADIIRHTFTNTTLDHRRAYTTATVLRALSGGVSAKHAGSSIQTARASLEANGFVVVRGALDQGWLRDIRPALRDYVLGHIAGLDVRSRSVGASASAPTFSLRDAPPAIRDFIIRPSIGTLAASLLGVPAVRLLHFCGFFKSAGGEPTPRHRDIDFIPLATDRIVTAWIPLVDVDPDMGGLLFTPGSHREQAVPQPETDIGTLRLGDVSFHLGHTLHGARGNRSDRMREIVAICFYADGARIAPDNDQPFRAALRRQCFPHLGAGGLAAGPDNPIVASATEGAGAL